jgi:DNA mismatch repair ATPase MutS
MLKKPSLEYTTNLKDEVISHTFLYNKSAHVTCSISSSSRKRTTNWCQMIGSSCQGEDSASMYVISSLIIDSTKHVRRYHTPYIKKKIQERAQHMERLDAEADTAYKAFLTEIADVHYGALRDAIQKLATADCLLALAQLALQPGYVKPQFCDEDVFEVIGGRHPMLEQLRSDPYVPNDLTMGDTQPRSKVITGTSVSSLSDSVS